MKEDDEDGEDVPQRTGRENGSGDGKHAGHVDRRGLGPRWIGGSSTGEAAGGGVEGVVGVVLWAGIEAFERPAGARAGAVVHGAAGRSRDGVVCKGSGSVRVGRCCCCRCGGGRLRHRVVYVARGRRRIGLGLAIGVAVEVRVAALLGRTLADGRCEATLISSAVMLGGPLSRGFRYHVRGRQRAESADTAGRLDWCTGRARLGDGGAGWGRGKVSCEVDGLEELL